MAHQMGWWRTTSLRVEISPKMKSPGNRYCVGEIAGEREDKAAKGGPVKKISKKKGLVDVARVFSDDKSSDGTQTSPADRSLHLSTAPILPLDAGGEGGSTAIGALASADRIVTAAARAKGKEAAVETSTSEYSLAGPHFAPGDFESRAELIPFVEGVSNLVLPASTPSLFTELNEFDEGCSAIKSLAVRKGKEARAEIDRLKAKLEKEKAHSAALTDYYNLTEPKMEALRLEVSKAEASAVEESRWFSREMAKATESARTACQTLRLALTDMAARTQQDDGAVSDYATAYGDCYERVSAAFTMGLLQQFGYEHVAEFPNYTKGDWEISAHNVSPALRSWRKQFWQKDGRSTAKARLLEQLAKAEAADRCEEEDAAAEGGGGDT
uniref:OSJNBa0059D20.4 protein n=1 Tax=Oryza sativa subsp. japonica TaxID=39947 RepID=Q7XSK9_ORYSJ|nr:OSJNBa0059D20.4 [Oryza sativa Japonica Group]